MIMHTSHIRSHVRHVLSDQLILPSIHFLALPWETLARLEDDSPSHEFPRPNILRGNQKGTCSCLRTGEEASGWARVAVYQTLTTLVIEPHVFQRSSRPRPITISPWRQSASPRKKRCVGARVTKIPTSCLATILRHLQKSRLDSRVAGFSKSGMAHATCHSVVQKYNSHAIWHLQEKVREKNNPSLPGSPPADLLTAAGRRSHRGVRC